MTIDQNTFVSIKPKNELISEHIAYYYFHQTHDENQLSRVIYYPHYQDALNVYRHANVYWDELGRSISAAQTQASSCFYTSNQRQSRMVTMGGNIHKLGIVFNPLGLNHFIDVPFNHLITGVVTQFDYFGESFMQLTKQLFAETDEQIKRDRLDNYFANRFVGFEDHALKHLVRQLLNVNPSMEVSSMAALLKVSNKTVLRRFKQQLGHTPREFKAVIKFRRAMAQYQLDKQNAKPNLTEIGVNSAYYDQSDFINQYKSLVGLTPSQLFARLHVLGNNNTFWTYV